MEKIEINHNRIEMMDQSQMGTEKKVMEKIQGLLDLPKRILALEQRVTMLEAQCEEKTVVSKGEVCEIKQPLEGIEYTGPRSKSYFLKNTGNDRNDNTGNNQ